MPAIAASASPTPPVMDVLAQSGGGSPAAGPMNGQAAGPPDMTAVIGELRQAAQPMLDWFAQHPELQQEAQALQTILQQSLMKVVQVSGVQTPSSAAVPMGSQ